MRGFLFFFLGLPFFALVLAQEWKQFNSDHFIIYYTGDEEKTATEISRKAEAYYERIALDIGYPRYSEFWTWNKRVSIYLYPDRQAYIRATGQTSWSEGMADYSAKKIASYKNSKGFLDSILPHEIAHLIFRDFVGFRGEIPLWLDEGVAQWAEAGKRQHIRSLIKKIYQEDSLLSLKDLTSLDIRNLKDTNRIFIRPTRTTKGEPGVLFVSLEQLLNIYYLESASVVGFLIERFGSYAFANFCRALRDGKSIDDALKSAYVHINNLEELEDLWRKYLAE